MTHIIDNWGTALQGFPILPQNFKNFGVQMAKDRIFIFTDHRCVHNDDVQNSIR